MANVIPAPSSAPPLVISWFLLVRRRSAVLGWQGWGEEIDEQLGDPLRLIVMDPMRRAGQALDAVQVGHIVVVGLG
jgi:hypothetical protein